MYEDTIFAAKKGLCLRFKKLECSRENCLPPPYDKSHLDTKNSIRFDSADVRERDLEARKLRSIN